MELSPSYIPQQKPKLMLTASQCCGEPMWPAEFPHKNQSLYPCIFYYPIKTMKYILEDSELRNSEQVKVILCNNQ